MSVKHSDLSGKSIDFADYSVILAVDREEC
jgi:hypothetical protein